MKTEYWTLWGPDVICTRHRTLKAAEKAMRKCENEGGAFHRIVKVEEVRGYPKKVRRG